MYCVYQDSSEDQSPSSYNKVLNAQVNTKELGGLCLEWGALTPNIRSGGRLPSCVVMMSSFGPLYLGVTWSCLFLREHARLGLLRNLRCYIVGDESWCVLTLAASWTSREDLDDLIKDGINSDWIASQYSITVKHCVYTASSLHVIPHLIPFILLCQSYLLLLQVWHTVSYNRENNRINYMRMHSGTPWWQP